MNWSIYSDNLKRCGLWSIWFDPEMVWTLPPSGKRSRQQLFSDTAIQACLTLSPICYVTSASDQFVESLLRLLELDWAVSDFSTLCQRPGYGC